MLLKELQWRGFSGLQEAQEEVFRLHSKCIEIISFLRNFKHNPQGLVVCFEEHFHCVMTF